MKKLDKICFLILAHKNPQQLKRLIDSLGFKHFDIFVHVDGKVPLDDFCHSGATFLSSRIKCYWGDFSLVQATLNLLKEARSQQNKYAYYVFLSGMDYPIKSNQVIYDRILSSDNDYMDYFYHNEKTWHRRYRRYHFPNPESDLKTRVFKRIIGSRLLKFMPERKLPLKYKPCWGSQWWILSAYAIDYLFYTLKKHPKIIRFFKYCRIPDEMFFHIILTNSPVRERIRPGLNYIDWTQDSYHPKTLTYAEDFDFLMNTEKLFARKFNCQTDTLILDHIDAELRS